MLKYKEGQLIRLLDKEKLVKPLLPKRIGCYVSHVKAVRTFLEDDFLLDHEVFDPSRVERKKVIADWIIEKKVPLLYQVIRKKENSILKAIRACHFRRLGILCFLMLPYELPVIIYA